MPASKVSKVSWCWWLSAIEDVGLEAGWCSVARFCKSIDPKACGCPLETLNLVAFQAAESHSHPLLMSVVPLKHETNPSVARLDASES